MTNLTKTYNILIRTLIISVTYGFILYEIFGQQSVIKPLINLQQRFSDSGFAMSATLLILLMIVNWSLEAIKWRFLISKFEKISFLTSMQAVFSGLTVSIFTPNRIGEYFGRVFILKQINPLKGILITILGSMAQLVVYLLSGLICFVYFLDHYVGAPAFFGSYFSGIAYLSVIGFALIITGLFMNVSFITGIANRILSRKWRKLRHYLKTFSLFSKKELLIVLLISALRYCVFTFQYYFLLKYFGIDLPAFQLIIAIAVIFFIMTAIPTFALAELGIRSTVAVWVIGTMLKVNGQDASSATIAIITSASALWVINLGIPALIGSAFVMKLRFFKKTNTI
jgi:uncharacterized membrane protein YbhN (UPF0104 family)